MDDDFGVDEALNEVAYKTGLVVRGAQTVIMGKNSDEFVLLEKTEAVRYSLHPWTFVIPFENKTFDDWNKVYRMQVN